jgi:hypothetical protein
LLRKIEGFNICGEKGVRGKRESSIKPKEIAIEKIGGMLFLLSLLSGCVVAVCPGNGKNDPTVSLLL